MQQFLTIITEKAVFTRAKARVIKKLQTHVIVYVYVYLIAYIFIEVCQLVLPVQKSPLYF